MSPPGGTGEVADRAAVWRPATDPGLGCGGGHPPGPGRLDESARRLSHEELSVAQLMAAAGHDVASLADRRGAGRHADLVVCGTPVEVKSFDPGRARAPSDRSVFNKLADAAGQARHVVLTGWGSGLTEGTVRRGLARYEAAGPAVPPLESVRVLGDGFDLAWVASPGRSARREVPGPGHRWAAPGLGL